VLAILAVMKLREGIQEPTLSATPAYDDSRISVPPAAAADYNEHDSKFAPHPFSYPAANPVTESPAY